MKKTLQDIATETGYSITTVSRALNGSKWVAPNARNLILNSARKIGYIQGKQTVAFIVQSLTTSSYYRELLNELYNSLQFANFKMEMIGSDSLELLEEHNLCGAISIMLMDGLEQYWGKHHIMPLVCINTQPRHFDGIYTVASNEEQGTKQLIDHLIQLGHNRISFLASQHYANDVNYCNRMRVNAFKKVMKQHKYNDDLIFTRHWDIETYILTIRKIIDAGATAIATTVEGDSARILHVLKLMGKRVPEDISVVGWLDSDIDPYCNPPITGVKHNYTYLAKHAYGMFNKLIHKESVTDDIIIDYNFFPGNSTAPPSK